jgi:hypothetical protein
LFLGRKVNREREGERERERERRGGIMKLDQGKS